MTKIIFPTKIITALSVLILSFVSAVWFSPAAADEPYRIYTLACPFTTVTDEISLQEFEKILLSDTDGSGEIRKIVFSEEAAEDLADRIPEGCRPEIEQAPADHIKKEGSSVSCAVVPIDRINPTMKTIRVGNDYFPWDQEYHPEGDLLAVKSDAANFDRARLTTVLLTGTTALVRTTSYKMYLNGPLYPAEEMKPIFDASDITHISNEASIWSLCPAPLNTFGRMQFCSNADAIELFDYLGVDVIELSGNHLRDYDWKPLSEMLDLFDEKGYAYYAAGRTIEEAARPQFIEHNGNKFVFLGCNIAGPDHVYVSDSLPGVNHCDLDEMEFQVRRYRQEGYQVIVTLQYYETYSRVPTDMQRVDFQRLSDAGAVIVSGSQAHYPQTFAPFEDRFIHYGLGNLFFDQMDTPVEGTAQEFLDRYVFYDGRLLGVQLITARLTDFARPVLMSDEERPEFLREIFSRM